MTDPEFPRPIRIDTLGTAPRGIEIEAEEGERAALAKRFGLIAIERLAARAEALRSGDEVRVSGRLEAAVTQACVASGQPVPATIDEPFALRFLPERADGAPAEVELEVGDLDTIPYEGGAIDLGEAVAQTLALALDPFPRSPGADEALRAAGVIGEDEAGPFAAALKGLRDKLKGAGEG